jgi:hypothetical protein
MKNWKSLLVTVFGFFGIAGMLLLNSCTQDPCTELVCQNGGTCSDGYCQCPTGFEGAECDIEAANRFVGKYAGSLRCNNFPIQADTITIDYVSKPNQVRLRIGAGNTALLGFTGTAQTPETHFQTYVGDGVTVHAYVTVDGGLLAVYLETINTKVNTRQICRFSGIRIPN